MVFLSHFRIRYDLPYTPFIRTVPCFMSGLAKNTHQNGHARLMQLKKWSFSLISVPAIEESKK
jgi:hypothetical protein